MKEIKVKEISISNNSPMTIIAGLNVLRIINELMGVSNTSTGALDSLDGILGRFRY